MDSEHSNTSDDSLTTSSYFSTDNSSESDLDYFKNHHNQNRGLRIKESKTADNNNGKRRFKLLMDSNYCKIECCIPKSKPKKVKESETQSEICCYEDIVISGISGRFPGSDNVNELIEHMYSQRNFTTTSNDVWDYTFNDKIWKRGQIKDCETFDAPYFDINKIRAKAFNNELRFLCECVGESILDSGLKIEDLYNSDTGVFIGCNVSEEFGAIIQDDHTKGKYTLSGCIKTMYANHIRDIFKLQGPITCIDADNSSSIVALEWAINAIRNGKCTRAIVGGVHTNREPNNPLILGVPKGVNEEGRKPTFVNTKYYRTETVGVLFLQSKEEAKRVYATVFDMDTIPPPHKPSELLLPTRINYTPQCVAANKERLERCLGETYNAAIVDENDVGYIELSEYGHNPVTKFELDAICDVLAFDRTPNNPLFVGSLTTNIGHAGPASGILAIIKIIISMEKNLISPTKHMNLFALDSPGLDSKKLKVVFETTPFVGEYAGVNSISFKNYFSHAILKKNTIEKSSESIINFSPKLLVYQSRSFETLNGIFNEIQRHSNNDYLLQMLCEQALMDKKKFPHRGYLIFNRRHTDNVICEALLCNENIHHNIWFFFKLGNDDYLKIGKELMKLPYFDASLRYSSKYLCRKHEFNVYKYFIFDELPEFGPYNGMLIVAITVILALYDLMESIGICPSGMIGYSLCEILCGYGSEILTREQILDIAVIYSKLPINSVYEEGKYKIAVVKSYLKEVVKKHNMLDIVCEISEDNIIIIGESKEIDMFINTFDFEAFTKYVNNPYDSFFSIHRNVEGYMNYLKNDFEKIFPSPHKYPTWVSATTDTYFKNRTGSSLSGDYFIQNISKPVMLKNALKKVPNDGLVVILGTSDNFIKSILDNELPRTCKTIQLLSEDPANVMEQMLTEIGKLYMYGCDIKVDKIYPKLPYPAPRGTPMIAPHWKWNKEFLWNQIDRDIGNELYGEQLLNQRHEDNRHLNPKFSRCDPHSCWCIDNSFINGPIFTFVDNKTN